MFQEETSSVDPTSRRRMMTLLLQDTIVMLCKNMIKFDVELSVEGLLGVTVDKNDIVLINIREIIAKGDSAGDACNGREHSEDELSMKPNAEVSMKLRTAQMENKVEKISTDAIGNKVSPLSKSSRDFSSLDGIMHLDSVRNKLSELKNSDGAIVQTPCSQISSNGTNAVLSANYSTGYEKRQVNKSSGSNLVRSNSVGARARQTLNSFISHGGEYGINRRVRKRKRLSNPSRLGSVKTEPIDVDLADVTRALPPPGHRFDSSSATPNTSLAACQSSVSWPASASVSQIDDTGFLQSSATPGDADEAHGYCGTGMDPDGTMVHFCAVCSKRFTSKHHVRRHYNSRHAFAPLHYFCSTCGAGFRRRDVMLRHCRAMHADQTSESWIGFDVSDGERLQQADVIQTDGTS